ncbi:MAG: hypothetical protein Kow0013_27330 [Pararhodobacter sp.]
MYRVAGRGDGGNRGPLRRMTLGAFPLIDLRDARERARAAIDLADRGDDPAAIATTPGGLHRDTLFDGDAITIRGVDRGGNPA